MARRNGGLRTAVKIVKTIDRMAKQQERENARVLRQEQRYLKEQERAEKQLYKQAISDKKAAFRESLNQAKEEYKNRCLERYELRVQFSREVFK